MVCLPGQVHIVVDYIDVVIVVFVVFNVVFFNIVVFVLLFCLGQTLPNGLPPWIGLHCGCLWFGCCCCFCCCFVVVEIHQNT